jgi:hypothetical protein
MQTLLAETLIMSAVSSVSSPNYAQAVSGASAPGKPSSADKSKDEGSPAGATTATKNATLSGKLNVVA